MSFTKSILEDYVVVVELEEVRRLEVSPGDSGENIEVMLSTVQRAV